MRQETNKPLGLRASRSALRYRILNANIGKVTNHIKNSWNQGIDSKFKINRIAKVMLPKPEVMHCFERDLGVCHIESIA